MESVEQPLHLKTDHAFSAYVARVHAGYKLWMSIIKNVFPLLKMGFRTTTGGILITKENLKEAFNSIGEEILNLGLIHRTIISIKRARVGPSGLTNPRIADDTVVNFLKEALGGVPAGPGFPGQRLIDIILATTHGVVNMSMLTTLFIIYVRVAGIPKRKRRVMIEDISANLLTRTFANDFEIAKRTLRRSGVYDNFIGTGAREFTNANFQTIVHTHVTAFPSTYEAYAGSTPAVQGLVQAIFSNPATPLTPDTYSSWYAQLQAQIAHDLVTIRNVNNMLKESS